MHENDLQFNNWQQLTNAQRRANFGQVLRYFVSPLVAVDWIEPMVVQFQQTIFKTYSAWILGEKFVFIPAQVALSLGWSAGASKLAPSEWFAQTNHPVAADAGVVFTNQAAVTTYIDELTSETRVVNMPALLVAQTAQPLNWLAQGLYTIVSGQFSGNQQFYRHYQAELQHLRYQAQNASAPYFESEHLVIKPVMQAQAYQVFEKITLTESALQQTLQRQGFDFISPDQYEWLKGAGTPRLWTTGNHLPSATLRDQQPFGLDFMPQAVYEVTNNPLIYKGGPCVTGGRYQIEQLLPASPFYESGIATAAIDADPPERQYRRTITVALQ